MMDEAKFEALLQNVLQPDTAKVKEATATLRKEYYRDPQSLALLLHILAAHPDSNMRQLAAVQAKTLTLQHWEAVPKDSKPQIRQGLLKSTLDEKASLVRHSAARLIAVVASMDFENNEWGDLPQTLEQASLSQNVAQREVGVYILFALLEQMAETFTENLDRFFTLFEKTIKDPASFDVRLNTLMALGIIGTAFDVDEDKKSLKSFHNIFPSLVAVLKEAVESGDDKQMVNAFKSFIDFLSCDSELTAPHFPNLVQFMMQLSSATDLSDEARAQAIVFLQQCVITRRMKMQSLKVGEQLTLMAMKISVELDGEKREIDDDITPGRAALALIDVMAQLLPPPHVVVPLMKALPQYVNSSNPDERRGGIFCLGFCAEGAPDFLSTQMKEIMPVLLRLLQDPYPQVRLAATHTLARIAEEMSEVLEAESESLLEALVKNLDEAQSSTGDKKQEEMKNEIIAGVCSALDTLVVGLDKDDAIRYLPELAPRLGRLFDHEDEKVQLASIAAMGSLAGPCEDGFMPVFEKTMHALSPYITKKESNRELDLRAVVSDAMCSMMSAVGPAATKPFVQPMMTASEEALKLESSGLRESSYFLWATFAKIYGPDFAHFANGAISALLESLDQEEMPLDQVTEEELNEVLGPDVSVAKKKSKEANGVKDGDDSDDDFDIEDLIVNEDEWDDYTATSAIAEEKEMALEAVGDVMTHVKVATLSFVPQVLAKVIELASSHPYEGIKKASLAVMWRVYTMCFQLAEEKGQMAKWEPGFPLKVQPPDELMQIAAKIMPETLTIWGEELDRDVVVEINRNLGESLKLCGPAIIQNEESIQAIITILVALIQKAHPSQIDPLDDDEDGGDELQLNAEYDWLVIDTALDCVANLAKAIGKDFAQFWKLFQKHLVKHAGSGVDYERSTAVGALSECIGAMGPGVTPHTPALLKILVHRLSDESFEVRANAAFGVGLLCYHSTSDEIPKAYLRILSKLVPSLQSDTTNARMLDNAAGCVSRMIQKHPESVPLDEVLPALIDILPLREDYEENEAVWPMIVALYEASNPIVRAQSPAIVKALASTIGEPLDQLTDDTRATVINLIKYLHKLQPTLIANEPALVKAAQS